MRCKRYKRAAYKVKSERNKITRRILHARNRISRNRISHLWTRGNIPHRSSVRNTFVRYIRCVFVQKLIKRRRLQEVNFSAEIKAARTFVSRGNRSEHPLKRDYEDFFFPFSKHSRPRTRFENSRNVEPIRLSGGMSRLYGEKYNRTNHSASVHPLRSVCASVHLPPDTRFRYRPSIHLSPERRTDISQPLENVCSPISVPVESRAFIPRLTRSKRANRAVHVAQPSSTRRGENAESFSASSDNQTKRNETLGLYLTFVRSETT